MARYQVREALFWGGGRGSALPSQKGIILVNYETAACELACSLASLMRETRAANAGAEAEVPDAGVTALDCSTWKPAPRRATSGVALPVGRKLPAGGKKLAASFR